MLAKIRSMARSSKSTRTRATGAPCRVSLATTSRDQNLCRSRRAFAKSLPFPRSASTSSTAVCSKLGYFADVAIFDPATIIDDATYTKPAQTSKGVDYVFVNGQLEFDHGKLTGVTAGKPLRGPGYKKPDATPAPTGN